MTKLKFADRVQETTVSAGTGAVVPNGAVAGYRSFAEALAEGDRFHYLLTGGSADPAAYEVGVGTWTGGAIVRAPIVSSAGGAAIGLAPGTKTIAVTLASAFLEAVQAQDVFTAWQALPGNAGRTMAELVAALGGALHDADGRVRVAPAAALATIDYLDGGSGQGHPVLRFNTNNRAMFRQRSASGTDYISYPYFDANDALTTDTSSTLVMSGPVRTAGFLAQTACLAINATSGMANGGYLASLTNNAPVTGTVNGVYAVADASVKLENQTINVAAGGKTGSKLRSSGGDLYREFCDETNARQFTHTYYAASATFRLDNAQQGGQFASRHAYEVDWAKFQVSFAYPVRLPTMAVAALPGAATAGAGAIAYCSDEAGGGVPVFSDGTSWRRMTDRAVASA